MTTKYKSWLHNHPTYFQCNRRATLSIKRTFFHWVFSCQSRASLFSFLSIITLSSHHQQNSTSLPFIFNIIIINQTQNRIVDRAKTMAACGSLQHIFDNPLPEKPTLLESLSSSWNQIKPVKTSDQPSFVEIFSELHFEEKSQFSSSDSSSSSFPMPSSSSPSSSSLLGLYPPSCYGLVPNNENKKSSLLDSISNTRKTNYSSCHNKTDSFSSMNSESLQLCTEGLGSESFDDVEDLKSESNEEWQKQDKKVSITEHSATENLCGEIRRSKTLGSAFPPPISCIGMSGKPWVCFKSYRHDGRFVLKEVRMPSQEFLQACREGGRLKLQFVQPNDDVLELEDEDCEEDEELEDEEEDDELEDVADEERRPDGRGN